MKDEMHFGGSRYGKTAIMIEKAKKAVLEGKKVLLIRQDKFLAIELTKFQKELDAMHIDNIIDQLKRDEGFRSESYTDTTGNITIGYGHKLFKGFVDKPVSITEDQANKQLIRNIALANENVLRYLPWTGPLLDNARYSVLVNMCFNMGIQGLLLFRVTLALIKQREYDDAAAEMLRSVWASQVGNSAPCEKYPIGQRAWRLAEQMRTGEWK